MASTICVVGLLLLAVLPASSVKSFGTGNAGQICLGVPLELFQHSVSSAANTGVMSHFWTTGSSEQALAASGLELQFSYYFDAEATPSIAFEPAKAAGQFFGAVDYNGTWADGTRAATRDNLSLFTAGDKAGKNAVTQGWWNQYKMPFERSVRVIVGVVPRSGGPIPKAGVCASYYAVVRGYEVPAKMGIAMPTGFVVPPGARLELHEVDMVAQPGAFTPLLTLPAGSEALLFALGLGLETSPPWGTQVNGKLQVGNNYVEGCWSLLRNTSESLPGMVLGTGLEDFWDSGYGFSLVDPGMSPLPPSSDTDSEIRLCRKVDGKDTVCTVTGAPFQHPSAGVLHYSSDYTNMLYPNGVERFSAYRFFDHEMVGMDDGGKFGWTNGCATWNQPGTNKCGVPPPKAVFATSEGPKHADASTGICKTSPTHITAYVWVYTWAKSVVQVNV